MIDMVILWMFNIYLIKAVYGMIGRDNDDIYMVMIEYTYTSYSQAQIIFWILITLISIAALMILLYAFFDLF